MSYLRYALAATVAASWYAPPLLGYLVSPAVSGWLVLIFFVCWIPLFFVSFSALSRRHWKTVAVVSVAWALAILPIFDLEVTERLRFWIYVQGSRIHVAPVDQYLSKCELVEFVEDGVRHRLGECEARMLSSNFWDAVFYDTTGQFAVPPVQRTQGWKDAMYGFSSYCYLTEKATAERVFEDFYGVSIPGGHVGGC